MTRLPAENRDVTGIPYCPEFPRYKVGPICSVPGCSRLADHAHHIWRRSSVIGDKGWVKLWDGTIVQNLTGLCWRHHENVTLNRSDIQWSEMVKKFLWIEGGDVAQPSFFLDPQPKIWSQEPEEEKEPVTSYGAPGTYEKCPTCNRKIPHEHEPKRKREAARRRKTWTVTVPDDAEDGASVLDTLVETLQDEYGFDSAENLRYFVLTHSLYLLIQNKDKLTSES